ncbi:MAG: hypothetical protein LBT97_13985 [Planctomycetota bacterium]|jgi:hypothetical protein|nr:hypothetical protein [Planctomycetota bacterium]
MTQVKDQRRLRCGRTRIRAVFLRLPLFSLLLAGCVEGRHLTATLGSSSKPYQEFLEDPVALTTIRTIAVFPFENRSSQSGFDSEAFANKLANQLAAHGKVRVLYPQDILEFAERENAAARRHNAMLKEKMQLGLYIPEHMREGGDGGFAPAALNEDDMRPRRYYDPIKNVDEAVKLARRAKADAIIMGEVSDFDPYMRPRISLSMRLIATGNSDTAARTIAELTQWGIPRPATSAKGVIYVRQQNFDSSFGNIGLEVSRYGRTHLNEHNPYGTEVFVRSMTYYYEVVAGQLAAAYVDARKKAIDEAEKRARSEAKARRQDQDAAVRRITAMMERDARIPDFETDQFDEAYFDQAFADKSSLIAANNGDKRIQSWRADGRALRLASGAERSARDSRIPENERGRGFEGYPAMVDSDFPDADLMMERNLGDNRDRSWRPDYYNHANPQKSAPLYGPGEYRGDGGREDLP